MANTRETLAIVLRMLRIGGAACDVSGGWAEELLGLREPWKHGDIDLVLQGNTFERVDELMTRLGGSVCEVPQKRFAHKRAFVFRQTLCEITRIGGDEMQPVTHYWGDVPFFWHPPLLHDKPVVLNGETITVLSAANLEKHRLHWQETQPHRWRDPRSLVMPLQVI